MKKILTAVMLLMLASVAHAQVSVPNTFVTGTRILASEVNANFSALASDALNRTGGTITGNITVSGGVTIDGVDVGTLSTAGTPTFSKIITSSTASDSATIGGGLTIGTGAVQLVGVTGKIPAITSAYFTSVDGTGITGIVNTGYTVSTKTTTYTATTADGVLLGNGTFTITLYTASGNSGKILQIKNIGSGSVTIDGAGSETIDGALTYLLDGQYFSITLFCTGTEWVII